MRWFSLIKRSAETKSTVMFSKCCRSRAGIDSPAHKVRMRVCDLCSVPARHDDYDLALHALEAGFRFTQRARAGITLTEPAWKLRPVLAAVATALMSRVA